MDYENSLLHVIFRGADRYFFSLLALFVSFYMAAHAGELGNAVAGLANMGGASVFETIVLYIVLWGATFVNAGGMAGYQGFWITFWVFSVVLTSLALYQRDRFYGLLSVPVAFIISLLLPLLIIAWTAIGYNGSTEDLGFIGAGDSGGMSLEGVGFLLKYLLLLCLCLVLSGALSFIASSLLFVFVGDEIPPDLGLLKNSLALMSSTSLSQNQVQVGRYYRGRGFCPLCGQYYSKALPKTCSACKHDLVMTGNEVCCPQCDSPAYSTERFCRYCGANIFRHSNGSETETDNTSFPHSKVIPANAAMELTIQHSNEAEIVHKSTIEDITALEPPTQNIAASPRQRETNMEVNSAAPQHVAITNSMKLFCRRCGAVHPYTQQGKLCLQCGTPVKLPSLAERDRQCNSCNSWLASSDLCCWQCGARL